MCVACHGQDDPDFPSTLLFEITPDRCGDCHMKVETVDVAWVRDMDRPVAVSVRGGGAAGGEAEALIAAMVSETLRARGFRLVGKDEADLAVTLALSVRSGRDDRFLPPGTPVRTAVLAATVYRPGEASPLFRRRGASRPAWGETEGDAVARALGEAWKVLSPHLLEALASH